MARYSLLDDVRALVQDGRKDGAVNSDTSLDDALEDYARDPASWSIEAAVQCAAAKYRSDLLEEHAAESGVAAFILYPDGDPKNGHRPQPDTQRLLDAYVSAWASGFRSRLEGSVARGAHATLRADLEGAVTQELTRRR